MQNFITGLAWIGAFVLLQAVIQYREDKIEAKIEKKCEEVSIRQRSIEGRWSKETCARYARG